MSDETQEPKEDSPKPKKPMSPMFRNMIMAFLAIMLLLIVHVAGNIRAAGTQRADQLRMINAIASTLNDPVLQRDTVKLRRICENLAQQGAFERVSITQVSGEVIVTTDRTKEGTVLEHCKKAPNQGKIEEVDGHRTLVRSIFVAEDNPIAAIEIKL
ncbi:MAG: hypothetical protein KDC26_05825 [Armatimonadetes bacterium]|nr:hypothetical protein [Armatimonadota bacterium]